MPYAVSLGHLPFARGLMPYAALHWEPIFCLTENHSAGGGGGLGFTCLGGGRGIFACGGCGGTGAG